MSATTQPDQDSWGLFPYDASPPERILWQERVQALVDGVFRHHQGDPVDTVRQALEDAIALAGLPQQPAPWLSATASVIAEGRHVVVSLPRH